MKLKIVLLLLVTQLFSQTVDFMSSDFKEIVRFDEIEFKDGMIKDSNLSKIISSHQGFIDKGLSVYVSIIGHSSENAEKNISLMYANNVRDLLAENNISESMMFVDVKEQKEPLYVSDDEELNHRVMVTLYVLEASKDPCQRQGIVVLMDNNKAKNAINFSNDVSSQDVDKINDYVIICKKDQELGSAQAMSEDEIEMIFPYVSKQKRSQECEGKVRVVLIDNGKDKNAVVVRTDVGEQIIERTNHYVKICSKDQMPTAPQPIDNSEVGEMFPYVAVQTATSNFYFVSGNKLDPKSLQKLESLLEANKGKENLVITVKGYTDTLASREYNMNLAQERADAIEKVIKEIKPDAVVTKEIFGEDNLAVPTADEVLEPLNRRVEIQIHE